MSKSKELHQLYGGRKPKSYLPAHNHVAHVPESAVFVDFGFHRNGPGGSSRNAHAVGAPPVGGILPTTRYRST
jgi:hypothetical protein